MVERASNNGSTENKARRRRGRKSEPPAPSSTSRPTTSGAQQHSSSLSSSSYPPHSALLIQLDDGEPWYKYGQSAPDRDAVLQAPSDSTTEKAAAPARNPAALVQKYRHLADTLYRREVQLYSSSSQLSTGGAGNSSKKDERWVESTMRKGTLKDRIAAMSVVVSTDPVHKFYALDGLLQMAGCSTTSESSSSSNHSQPNTRVAQLAAEALEDLFLHTFLPEQRKLVTLAQRPLAKYENSNQNGDDNSNDHSNKKKKKKKTQKTLSPRILLLWRFEEMVKEKYDLFLRQYIAHTLQDGTLELQKMAALRSAATLLRAVPEGEAVLLPLLVNKLGDPLSKVAALAAHELRRTLQPHPAMQGVLAREVQQLAHRPHLSHSALYHCVTFLNQLKLTRPAAVGRSKTKKGDNGQEESLAASLIRTYFRLFEVAIQQKGSSKQDKAKQQQSSSSRNKKNRKTTTSEPPEGSSNMKSRLLSALLTGVNRAHPYLPAADQALEEHVDALYRVVHTAPPGARTQSLLLLFHLAVGTTTAGGKNQKQGDDDDDGAVVEDTSDVASSRRDRFYRALYSTLALPEMLGAGKHLTMFFNLLYKAMKYDTDTSRQVAFAKRILSTTLHCSASVTAASLFLINEVGKEHPFLLTCYQEVLTGADALRILDPTKREPRGALVSPEDGRFAHEDTEKRAPGWEIALTTHHYHPSVQTFAQTMGEESKYSGDPLKDFALAPFLDKFAYRNPKSVDRVAGKYRRGESVAERRSGTDSVIQTHFATPVNDPSFLVRAEVEVQDEFFHKFFVERAKRDQAKGIVRHAAGDNSKSTKENDEKADELEALEKVEEDIDGRNFADFEAGWETDEEEEAFVDSLAQKIIEDAVDDGEGPSDLDDEDPDMEGWDDMSYGEDGEDSGAGKEQDENSEEGISDAEAAVDDDAFMDDDDDSSVDDENDEIDAEVGGGGAFFGGHGDDENSDSASSDADSREGDLAFVDDDDDSSSEDDKAPQLVQLPIGAEPSGSFAAAEDYEEVIAKSLNERKRTQVQLDDNDDDVDSATEAVPKQKHPEKKKRKRRKKQKA